MDKDPAGNIPPSAPENNSPVEAPAPTRSLPSHEVQLSDRAKSATSPAAIRAVIQESLKPAPPQPAPTPEAPKPKDEAPADVEKPTEGQAPAEQIESQGEQKPPEEPTEVPSDPEEPDEGDGPVKIPTAKQLRISPSERDQVGRLTAALMRRNRDWTMEEALGAAKQQLGIKPAVESADKPKAPSGLPETPEAAEQAISTLEDQMDAANIALEFEKAVELRKQIKALERHRSDLVQQAQAKQAAEAEKFNQDFDASMRLASDTYAFVTDPNSPGYKKMLEIQEDMKVLGDPVYFSPEKPLTLAQMAAKELGIAPRRKGAPATPAKAVVPPPAPPKPKQVLPTGGSRTVVPSATPETAVMQEVGTITKVHDMRKFLKKLGVG